MRKVYSTTAGATFHQETPNYTFCFRKECIEAIIKMSPGEYVIINMTHTRDGHLLLFTNWGNYFNRMQNPAVQMPRIEKNCPTLYKVLVGEDPDNVREMVFGGKGHEMHGLGINLDSSVKIPIMLELDEKIMKTILTLANKVATICQELYDNPPFPSWKDGLDEVWN